MTIASGTCGDSATWRLEDDGTFYIEGTGAMNDYSGSYGVRPWDPYSTKITRVIVSEGITHVGNYSFYWNNNYNNLTTVSISSTVYDIGRAAFGYCEALESIDLGGVKKLGNSVFSNCHSLTTIGLENVTILGSTVFSDCTGLTSLTFGDLESIETEILNGCSSLKSIYIRSLADNLADTRPLFYLGNDSLETVTFGNDKLSVISKSMFRQCRSLKTVNLGGVTTIGDGAFDSCTGLKTIDISGVTQLGSGVFMYCTRLESVHMGSVTDIPRNMFYECTNLRYVDLEGVETIGETAFYKCASLTKAVFSESLTSIGNYAFGECTNCLYYRFKGDKPTLGSQVIGSTVSSSSWTWLSRIVCITDKGWGSSSVIGNYTWMFNFDTSIGDDITWSVDENMILTLVGTGDTADFSNSSSPFDGFKFKDILIDDRITKIGQYLFNNSCERMHSIKLPKSLKTIGSHAFQGNRFVSITIPENVSTVESGAIIISGVISNKHFVVIFEGTKPANMDSSSIAGDVGLKIHYFSSSHPDNDVTNNVNTTYPIMMRIKRGWKVIDSSYMIDNT